MKKAFTISAFFVCLVLCLKLQAQTVRTPLILNGAVYATAVKGDTVYIGGNFSKAGQADSLGSYGTVVDPITGIHRASWPKPNGDVYVAIPDGAGGFYIGGTFTMIGNEVRNRIAHIDQNGVVTPQLAGANLNNYPNSLILHNNILYVGGTFTAAGDNINANVPRGRLAAFDITTNQLTPWNPNTDSPVNSIALIGTTIYVGGSFQNIGGTLTPFFGAVSMLTGALDPWRPAFSSNVETLTVSGDTLFVGGYFTSVGGRTRNRIAAFKDTALLSWDPNASASVRSIVVTPNTIYVGGIFTTIGGIDRKGVASLDRATGMVNDWNPAPSTSTLVVNSIVLNNNILYVGGNFTNNPVVGGEVRNRLMALDVTIDTLMAQAFQPEVLDAYISCLAFSGNKLFAGGPYTAIGTKQRNKLAAFNKITGELLDWNPDANSQVYLLAVNKKTNQVYVGGTSLTALGGITISRLAAVDAETGALIPGALPPLTGDAKALIIKDDKAYICGTFTQVGDSARTRLAEIDLTTGIATAWSPLITTTVSAMNLKGDTLYIGGGFTNVNGTSRGRVAAFNISTKTLLSWNPNIANNAVSTMARIGETLYIGGTFTTAVTQSRNRLAALNLTGTGITTWNPNANNGVTTMAADVNAVYVGGSFSQFGSTTVTPKANIAVINATTAAIPSWTVPQVTSSASPYIITLDGSNVYAGLTSIPYFVMITAEASLPVTFASIKATRKNNDVNVQWSTASETNNSHFEVERSLDGEDFSVTGNPVTGAGNSLVINRYEFTDENAFGSGPSNLFYRVKQVDFDGNFSHSNAVRVSSNITETQQEFKLYPNPGKDLFTIDFNGVTGQKQIAVYDLKGNLVLNTSSAKSAENIDLSFCSQGIYMVKVITATGVSTSRLIIRN